MGSFYQPSPGGLKPAAFEQLVHRPFSEHSPLQLRQPPAELVGQVPFFQLCLALLQEISSQKEIKLTQTGRLPRQLCQQLFDLGLVDDFYVREWLKGLVRKESDWFHLHTLHLVLQAGHFVKKRRGRLSLTQKAEKLLAEPPALFLELVLSYLLQYDWATPDLYPKIVGQWGAGYGIWLLLRHGGEQKPPAFYGEKYREAFPFMLDYFKQGKTWEKPKEDLHRCFEWRFFHRFTELFGFTESEQEDKWREKMAWVKRTGLLEATFSGAP